MYAICPRLLQALTSYGEAYTPLAASIPPIERMRMTLAAIADHSYALLLDKFKIGICIVIDICHECSSFLGRHTSRPYIPSSPRVIATLPVRATSRMP